MPMRVQCPRCNYEQHHNLHGFAVRWRNPIAALLLRGFGKFGVWTCRNDSPPCAHTFPYFEFVNVDITRQMYRKAGREPDW